MLCHGEDIAAAIAAPRWRGRGGSVLLEEGHPAHAGLAARGHDVVPMAPGGTCLGAVVGAGIGPNGAPFAVAAWRRTTWAGVV